MSKTAAILALLLVMIVLLLETGLSPWTQHLESDSGEFYSYAKYFKDHGRLGDKPRFEYLPGAVVFFLSFLPIMNLSANNPLLLFRYALFASNLCLIILSAYLYRKHTGWSSNIIFALLLICVGPIVLYRFELLVSFLVVGSILLWTKDKRLLAMIFLGLATITKLYPIFLLPLFIITSIKEKGWKKTLTAVGTFILTIYIVTLSYMLFLQVKPTQMLSNITYHTNKGVHTESIWGSVHSFMFLMRAGSVPKGVDGGGIFAIEKKALPFSTNFYNDIQYIPVILIYSLLGFYMFIHKKLSTPTFITAQILLLAWFLLLGKVLAHQYLLWCILLIPLLEMRSLLTSRLWVGALGCVSLASILHQFIYPISYTSWMHELYENGSRMDLFWIIVLKNILLAIFTLLLSIIFIRSLKKDHYAE